MIAIMVYDTDKDRIEQICEKHNLTESEVIEMLLDYTEQEAEDIF